MLHWLRLVLGAAILLASLSGAVLVWEGALDRVLHPARYATSGHAMLTVDAYVIAARRGLAPGERIARLVMPEHGGPVVVEAVPAPGTPWTDVYLDPPTARVLAMASRDEGPLAFVRALHDRLLVPGDAGRVVVGLLGAATMVLVGAWLPWRRRGRAEPHLLGLVAAVALVGFAATGTWLAFASAAREATARPLGIPAQSVASVIARARPYGGGAGVHDVEWPAGRSPDWAVGFADGVRVKVADDSGGARAAVERRRADPTPWMRRVHEGVGMGIGWRLAISLAGLVQVLIGIVAWMRRRRG